MFCPKCGSMLRPKMVGDKKVMACTCGYKAEKSSSTLSLSGKKPEDKVADFDVSSSDQSVHSKTNEECPKCKNHEAYTWSKQMRAGDEPETIFFKCTKCEHTWREK